MNRERGSATLVLLTFLAVVSAVLIANAVVLHQLGRELRFIDKQQQKKFQTHPQ